MFLFSLAAKKDFPPAPLVDRRVLKGWSRIPAPIRPLLAVSALRRFACIWPQRRPLSQSRVHRGSLRAGAPSSTAQKRIDASPYTPFGTAHPGTQTSAVPKCTPSAPFPTHPSLPNSAHTHSKLPSRKTSSPPADPPPAPLQSRPRKGARRRAQCNHRPRDCSRRYATSGAFSRQEPA